MGNNTIYDIAEKAGVSPMTVSRILNNKGYVNETTAERVKGIAEELNYLPHGPAVSLVTQRTMTIGIILPDIANPIYPVFVNGIHDAIKKKGYHIMISNTYGDSEEELSILRVFLRNRVDGLILMALETTQDEESQKTMVRLLKESASPIVLSGRRLNGLKADHIMVDNSKGAYMAVEHLLNLGHRKIGHISGPRGVSAADLRFKGYQMALEEYGVPFDESLVIESNLKQEGGFCAMKEFMRMECPPTAIFAANDVMALGAMSAIREGGLRVPEDISIVGFDNIPLCALTNPGLTSVAQPEYEGGKKAAELLLRRIFERNSDSGKIEEIVLKPDLVVRQSTRRI